MIDYFYMNREGEAKMKRKIFMSSMIAILILLSIAAVSYAASKITLIVNGEVSNTDVKIINGVTYLPLRAIGDLLDVDVTFDNKSKTVSVSKHSSPSEKVSSTFQQYKDEQLGLSFSYPNEWLVNDFFPNSPDYSLTVFSKTTYNVFEETYPVVTWIKETDDSAFSSMISNQRRDSLIEEGEVLISTKQTVSGYSAERTDVMSKEGIYSIIYIIRVEDNLCGLFFEEAPDDNGGYRYFQTFNKMISSINIQ